MAYEKQTWVCGDTITADKMNHIENGIEEAGASGGGGSAPLIVSEVLVDDQIALDKTFAEIKNAILNGGGVLLSRYFQDEESTVYFLTEEFFVSDEGGGSIMFDSTAFVTESDNGHPTSRK